MLIHFYSSECYLLDSETDSLQFLQPPSSRRVRLSSWPQVEWCHCDHPPLLLVVQSFPAWNKREAAWELTGGLIQPIISSFSNDPHQPYRASLIISPSFNWSNNNLKNVFCPFSEPEFFLSKPTVSSTDNDGKLAQAANSYISFNFPQSINWFLSPDEVHNPLIHLTGARESVDLVPHPQSCWTTL